MDRDAIRARSDVAQRYLASSVLDKGRVAALAASAADVPVLLDALAKIEAYCDAEMQRVADIRRDFPGLADVMVAEVIEVSALRAVLGGTIPLNTEPAWEPPETEACGHTRHQPRPTGDHHREGRRNIQGLAIFWEPCPADGVPLNTEPDKETT